MANGFFLEGSAPALPKNSFLGTSGDVPSSFVNLWFGWLGSCSTVINTIEAVNFKSSLKFLVSVSMPKFWRTK